jgi:hypothetical protein
MNSTQSRAAASLAIIALFSASSHAGAKRETSKQAAPAPAVWAAANVGADGAVQIEAGVAQQYASSPATFTTSGSNGSYTVVITGANFNYAGNVQVVSTGSAATRCKVTLHSSNGRGHVIAVRCSTADGTQVASPFTVFFQTRFGASDVGAYLRYDANAAQVNANYSWASAGTNIVTWRAPGRYQAELGALAPNSAVHVTATGFNDSYCNVEGWSVSDRKVTVACFGPNGTPTDSGFSLLATPGATRAGAVGGHARVEIEQGVWAAPTANSYLLPSDLAAPYAPPIVSTIAQAGLTTTYSPMFFMENTPTFALVTAYGPGAGFCKVSSIQRNRQPRSTSVVPSCFTANSSPIARTQVNSVATKAAQQVPPG